MGSFAFATVSSVYLEVDTSSRICIRCIGKDNLVQRIASKGFMSLHVLVKMMNYKDTKEKMQILN